ncbi:MAG: SDR family NAD(P)-dependent oxidoreductase [bacterium]|nr:SDR family NAD(P)-dependent oxidoreductase [bacterium]
MKISNWNNRPVVENATLIPFKRGEKTPSNYCMRGNGRSYGDASLQHTIIDCTINRQTMELKGDILTASAGFTVTDILNFCIPKGYILPVIPGTQHATVGGMIAADVHGKNHEQNGTLGRWIESIEIQNQQGEIVVCSPTINTDLFQLTIGGLGLTGIVISAKFKLNPLNTVTFEQKVSKFPSLEALLEALELSVASHKTGWFDFFQMDQFLLLENAPKGGLTVPSDFQLRKAKLKVPFKSLPFVQPALMKIYNKRYARKLLKHKKDVWIDEVLFPLDAISNWNYLYGKQGFYQLQFSFPKEGISDKMKTIILRILESKFVPVLAVVKHHGEMESPGTLSFVQPGFSFAFDFVYKKGLVDFLRELNEEIADLGGRVYLVKDAVMNGETFEKMYSEAEEFKARLSKYNDGSIQSLLSNRINLTTSMNQRFLIIGANSDIAQACIPHFEKGGAQLILGTHKPNELKDSGHEVVEIDVTQPEAAIEKIASLQFDGVLYAAGSLPENEEALFGTAADKTIAVNYTGAVRILGVIAKKFIEQQKGTIVGISSAGAVRGKTTNIVYGSAKGGFDHYLAGLRQYLHPKGVRVVTIRPGFVATKMTKGLNLPEKLTASADEVAKTIVKHALKGNRNIVYTKSIWRPISWIIRNVPEPIFKRRQL